jgi:hypothetical protein
MDFYDDLMMDGNILFTVFEGTSIWIGISSNITN